MSVKLEKSLASQQLIDLHWKNINVIIGTKKQKTTSKTKLISKEPLLFQENQISDQLHSLSINHPNYSFKQILTDITGFAKHGETFAIMGPSGAGKTTLLAALTKKLQPSSTKIISGDICANSQAYDSALYNSFGVFVMQNDLLFPSMTVRETILFSAQLRLRGSQKSKEDRVNQLINDLQLTHVQNSPIGSTLIKGISGGEKKRVNIGVELVVDPIVVILDEPTSGLDSFTAYTTINLLKDLAKKENKCIIYTIHTPSYDIFSLMDKLLLLADGKQIYQGQAKSIIPYIRNLGIEIPEYQNICDFFMYEIDSNRKQTQLNSNNYEKNLRKTIDNELTKMSIQEGGVLERKAKNSGFYQLGIITKRSIQIFIRDPQLLKSRLINTIFFSAFYTILYWEVARNKPSNPSSFQEASKVNQYIENSTGMLFQIGAGVFFSSLSSVVMMFPRERDIFLKEENSKTYNVVPYFCGKILSEAIFIILQPVCQATIIYLAAGFELELIAYLKFILVCIFIAFTGNGIGMQHDWVYLPRCSQISSLSTHDCNTFTSVWRQILQYRHNRQGHQLDSIYICKPFTYYFEGLVRSQWEGEYWVIQTQQGDQYLNPIESANLRMGYWLSSGLLIGVGVLYHILGVIFIKLLIRRLNA